MTSLLEVLFGLFLALTIPIFPQSSSRIVLVTHNPYPYASIIINPSPFNTSQKNQATSTNAQGNPPSGVFDSGDWFL